MKKNLLILTLLTCFASFLSCKDNEAFPDPTTPGENTSIGEHGQAVLLVEQITNELEYLVRTRHPNGSSFLACATAQNEVKAEGLETTFTFSPTTTCSDGKKRSGKIIMLTKPYTDPADLEVFFRFEDYEVADFKLEGGYAFRAITEAGKASALETIMPQSFITMPGGKSIRYSVSRKSYLKEGQSTPDDPQDDVLELYDGDYGFSATFDALFQADMTVPLILKYGCPSSRGLLPAQGKVLIRTAGSNGDKTLNFGNGSCVAQAYIE